jgi:tetratricopeptide (TPR) repeat protein
MSSSQLNIFDPQTMIMSEGYGELAAFKFVKAAKHFREAVQANGSESEAEEALRVCQYWQPLIPQGREPPENHSIDDIYKKLRAYDFGNTSGLQQFRRALLVYITGRLMASDRFYINEGEAISDLLMEAGRDKRAEKIVEEQIEKRPHDHQIRYCQAQIQLQNGYTGEAKKNFARALLQNPCNVAFNRIEYGDLNTLIEDVGAEMTPAFGWVRDILPFVTLPEKIEICSKKHQKAVDCYRLLRLADKAAVKGNSDARLKYRKALHNRNPELYKEYFNLFSG